MGESTEMEKTSPQSKVGEKYVKEIFLKLSVYHVSHSIFLASGPHSRSLKEI